MRKYYARYNEDDPPPQELRVHLHEVSEACGRFLDCLGLNTVGLLIGFLHDVGKYNPCFQEYLAAACEVVDSPWYIKGAEKQKIIHAYCGAKFTERLRAKSPMRKRWLWDVVQQCIAGHHAGLKDMLDDTGDLIFYSRCIQENKTFVLDKIPDKEVAQAIDEMEFPQLNVEDNLDRFMFLKMVYSALIDADRLSASGRQDLPNEPPDWTTLANRLDSQMEKEKFKTKTDINIHRRRISETAFQAAAEDTGIFSLEVPTGGGKTFASLRFALNHARKHGMKRIIYVVPYTSIVDQNADEARGWLEEEKWSVVLEHHANLILGDDEEANYQSLTERWDRPVIFTTMVQFLNVLFCSKSASARRAHQLLESVIVFDEIQALPVNMVHLFNKAVNFLTARGKSSVVLCTATQPLLHETTFHKLNKPYAIIKDVSLLWKQLRRTRIEYVAASKNLETDDLIRFVSNLKVPSILIIVNTKAHAREIFRSLPDSLDKYHLSTNLCPAHRREIINNIRDRLPEAIPETPMVVVSTQLIECGVDIDFFCVIRMMAGLDSIAQAAGRCNRHGKRSVETVYVWHMPEEVRNALKSHPIGEAARQAERVFREFEGRSQDEPSDVLSPYWMNRYFKYYFYDQEGKMGYPVNRGDSLFDWFGTNLKGKQEFVRKNREGTRFLIEPPGLVGRYETAGAEFEAIEDQGTSGILVHWRDSTELIESFHKTYDPKELRRLMRQAQQYTVALLPETLKKLTDRDSIRRIRDDLPLYELRQKFGISLLYDEQLGVNADLELPVFLNG